MNIINGYLKKRDQADELSEKNDEILNRWKRNLTELEERQRSYNENVEERIEQNKPITTTCTYQELTEIAFDINTEDLKAYQAQKALIKARNKYQRYDLLLFSIPLLPDRGPIRIVTNEKRKRS